LVSDDQPVDRDDPQDLDICQLVISVTPSIANLRRC
jgi:hypothetical protein